MKKFLFLFLLIFFLAFTQEPVAMVSVKVDWDYTEFVQNEGMSGRAIKPTSDGGAIISGNYNKVLYLVKLDAAGKKEWSKLYYEGLAGFDVLETKDKGYLVVGQTRYADDEVNGVQGIITKVNNSGSVEWSHVLGGLAFDKFSAAAANDSGYLVGGSGSNGTEEGAQFVFLQDDGTIAWSKLIPKVNGKKAGFVADIVAENSGNFTALINYINSDNSNNQVTYSSVFSISADGKASWKRSFEGEGLGLIQDGSSGHVLSIRKGSNSNIIRIDKTGKTLWSKNYVPSFNKSYYSINPYSITKAADGGYIVAGDAGAVNSQIAYIYKTDPNGKRLWEKTFLSTNSIIWDISPSKDGSYLASGQLANGNGTKIIALKINLNEPKPIKVWVQNEEMNFDQPPIIENGTTLVPLRGIFERLGAEVKYNSQTKTITSTKGKTTITLTLNKMEAALKNESGQKGVRLLVPAKAIDGRTVVPLRFISESLGNAVKWDQKVNEIYID